VQSLNRDRVPRRVAVRVRTRSEVTVHERRSLALLAVSLWLSACTSLNVAPVLPPSHEPSQPLSLRATYKGDPRHLPPSVVAASTPDAPFEYAFRVDYERHDVPALLEALNPLTILGFPVGRTDVTAVATLTAREAGVVVKRYEATAVARQTRTMYSSDSQTELRARALAAVRDNIEAQISADAQYLLGLQAAAAQTVPPGAEAQP